MFILIHLISLARRKITVSLSQLTAASCVLSTKMSSKRFKKKKKARQRIKRRSLITSWCKKRKKKIRKKKFHIRPSGRS